MWVLLVCFFCTWKSQRNHFQFEIQIVFIGFSPLYFIQLILMQSFSYSKMIKKNTFKEWKRRGWKLRRNITQVPSWPYLVNWALVAVDPVNWQIRGTANRTNWTLTRLWERQFRSLILQCWWIQDWGWTICIAGNAMCLFLVLCGGVVSLIATPADWLGQLDIVCIAWSHFYFNSTSEWMQTTERKNLLNKNHELHKQGAY